MHYTTSCNTESSVPEDGRDQRPKHVELIGIINKPLSLHLLGVYIILIRYLFLIEKKINEIFLSWSLFLLPTNVPLCVMIFEEYDG